MNKVKVYDATGWNHVEGENQRLKRPGTREAINKIKAAVIEETEREVDATQLDGNGFLMREYV